MQLISNYLNRFADRYQDMSRLIETCTEVEVNNLDIPLLLQRHTRKYQATPYHVLKEIFERIAFNDLTILDIGSGKGRILYFALEKGSKKAIGVELSQELNEAAYRNLDNFSPTQYKLICDTVLNYDYADVPDVIFLFNPFDSEILKQMIDRLNYAMKRFEFSPLIVLINPIRVHWFLMNGFKIIDKIENSNPSFEVLFLRSRINEA